jgi:hypothetical protein
MSDYSIVDLRINGQRFYAVEKENKISFYTTNIAAARYWIRAEENDPTLIKPFQNTGVATDLTSPDPENPTDKPISEDGKNSPSEPAQDAGDNAADATKKPSRIS